jgi:hypothetical protein
MEVNVVTKYNMGTFTDEIWLFGDKNWLKNHF